MIKKQNALLQKIIATFGKVSGALSMWKEWLNDIRRKPRSNSHDGSNDSGDIGKRREADVLSEAGRTIAAIRNSTILRINKKLFVIGTYDGDTSSSCVHW